MLIGVPKEIKNHEYRVGMTPTSVKEAVRHGHDVWVQANAGSGIGASDADYTAAGAKIIATAAEIFGVAGLGQRMMQASTMLATDIVVVYMLTMALLYGVFDAAFTALQRWMLRWRA